MKRLPFAIHTVQYSEIYGDLDVYATGYCTPDIPGTMYRSNGDPGDPPEAGEIVFLSVDAYDSDGAKVFEHGKISQVEPDWEALEEKAREDARR